MHSKAKAPTKAERARMARIVGLGCVACRKDGWPKRMLQPEVHHLLDGGVRRGHDATICLCLWHHRGVLEVTGNIQLRTEILGPSLYHDAREFRKRYGTDDELLTFQNELLERDGQ